MLPLQGAWVRSLVRELRSHLPQCSQKVKKKKKEEEEEEEEEEEALLRSSQDARWWRRKTLITSSRRHAKMTAIYRETVDEKKPED